MFSADLGVTPSAGTLYADDVFSTFLYTGSGAALTINNGIDLAGKGGMVWFKRRSGTATFHNVFDTNRDFYPIYPNSSDAQGVVGPVITYNANGFSVTSVAFLNESGQSFCSWTFRKAPKFFDVVMYTGDGAGTSRLLNHNLGVTPGLYFIKSTSTTGDWLVGAPGLGTNPWANLNSTFNWGNNANFWLASSATTFGPGNTGGSNILNVNGQTYVAYLFADDPSTTGLIRCGSFTTDASGNASVTSLGWEPQFLMVKASSTNGDWIMLDNLRGWNMTSADALLRANLSNAETTSTEYGNPTATGFDFKGGSASATYVYMAIRRPNKPPTTGTEVLRLRVHSASSGGAVSQPNSDAAVNNVDAVLVGYRDTDAKNFLISDLLRGYSSNVSPYLVTSSTAAEASATAVVRQSTNLNGTPAYVGLATEVPARVSYAFKRAPGFFDIVCYTGTGATGNVVSHNLSVKPELIIFKNRSVGSNWGVCCNFTASNFQRLFLEQTGRSMSFSYNAVFEFSSEPTALSMALGSSSVVNNNTNSFVAYVFTSLPGISKIGTYTGNGTTQTINCGFAAGARFVLIKRTDAAGDWFIFDSARGIVAANDPHLSMNSTAAEVTDNDSVDPVSSGFAVNQDAATNINVSSAGYLYLAIA